MSTDVDLYAALERVLGHTVDWVNIPDAPTFDFDAPDPREDHDPHGHHADVETSRMERAWGLGAASREGVL